MRRYIDANALIKKIYPMGIGDGKYTINAKAVKFAIDNTPTADVVPKSEVVDLISEIDAMIELVSAMTGIDIIAFGKYAELKKKYTGGFHEQNEV